jgi:hypothetical protein
MNHVEVLVLDAQIPVGELPGWIDESLPVLGIWNFENSISIEQSALQANIANRQHFHVDPRIVNST